METTPLQQIRALLKNYGAQAVLIRSTDRYFNEYVPEHLSPRAFISKFTGSVGDLIITPTSAHLFVDGRYALQAKNQALDFIVHVCEHNQSIENSWLAYVKENLGPGQKIIYDPNTLDLKLFEKLASLCEVLGAHAVADGQALIAQVFDPKPDDLKSSSIKHALAGFTGLSTEEKLQKIARIMHETAISGFLAVKLDDIAWMLNLRGSAFPFQRTFPGLACVLPDKIILGLAPGYRPETPLGPSVHLVLESQLIQILKTKAHSHFIMGIDASETSKAQEQALRALDIQVKRITNPIASLKAVKNGQELLHMRESFKKADHVVYQTQAFVKQSYSQGQPLSEGQIDDYLKAEFTRSGASELSFRPICAGGKNGAIIHYGTPNREQKVEAGSLFLLDTGAYYEGGYATDLTRTFLLGGEKSPAQKWQKEMFTLVLKASIRGLSARFRRGICGQQLDAMVRQPLWQAGVDYAHGTGHGVGINVHEFPPRIGPSSTTPLIEGQVFSIEPGLYFENLGGVRIENLVTVVADPDHAQFLRILPLTFCPFDEALIDHSMLDSSDQAFLDYFRHEWHNDAPMPNLPPLTKASFA